MVSNAVRDTYIRVGGTWVRGSAVLDKRRWGRSYSGQRVTNLLSLCKCRVLGKANIGETIA